MNTPNRTQHGNIHLLEFHQGNEIPTRQTILDSKGICTVLDDQNRYSICLAKMEGDEFIGFIPLKDDMATPLRGTAILGWAALPPAGQVLQKLYPQASAKSAA